MAEEPDGPLGYLLKTAIEWEDLEDLILPVSEPLLVEYKWFLSCWWCDGWAVDSSTTHRNVLLPQEEFCNCDLCEVKAVSPLLICPYWVLPSKPKHWTHVQYHRCTGMKYESTTHGCRWMAACLENSVRQINVSNFKTLWIYLKHSQFSVWTPGSGSLIWLEISEIIVTSKSALFCFLLHPLGTGALDSGPHLHSSFTLVRQYLT